MTASYLDEMSARVTELGVLADCTDDATIRAYLRDLAIKLDGWRLLAAKAETTLDYIAEDERQAALKAEERARQAAQNPGRGPSPAANCPSTAAGASDPGRGTSPLRTIDDVFAAASGRRGVVVAFPRDGCARNGEPAL